VKRVKVGVIGCGLIAQVMHLHYLRELGDRFEIAALCDISEEVREACAREYGVEKTFASWEEMLEQPLDAVLVLTSGSHAPIAVAAAGKGIHVFVEKPMCFGVVEGREMVAAAEAAGVTLMVGYNKRYDPAYRRLAEEKGALSDLRLVQITTLESPLQPYVQHYELHRAQRLPEETARALAADSAARVAAVIPEADKLSRWAYHMILLDTLVHELNAMRGVLGEPERLEFADIRETGLTAIFKYGSAQCILAWVDLPGIARYSMEFAFYSPERRLILSFPSPFLRSMPTVLATEEGEAQSPRSTRTEEITSFAESFKEELIHFHACVTEHRQPVTSGRDTLRDLALCEAIVAAHRTGKAIDHPSEPQLATAHERK